MSSSENLVPTSIVNANGIATTVYRKPVTTTTKKDIPAVTGRAAKPRTMKALISDAGLGLGMSKVMAKRIAQKSEELDPSAQTALLNLMNQIDRYATVTTILVDKFGSNPHQSRHLGLELYKSPEIEKFEKWVKYADDHLHAVDALVHEVRSSENSYRITNLTIGGLFLHEEHNYSSEQFRDIAMVTAAASIFRTTHQRVKHDLTKLEFMSDKNYEYLTSGIVLDRITESHEGAVEALRLITEEHVFTEAEMIHRLDGVPRVLVSGAV